MINISRGGQHVFNPYKSVKPTKLKKKDDYFVTQYGPEMVNTICVTLTQLHVKTYTLIIIVFHLKLLFSTASKI